MAGQAGTLCRDSPVKCSILSPITVHRVTMEEDDDWWLHFIMAVVVAVLVLMAEEEDFVLERYRVLQLWEVFEDGRHVFM